LTSPKDKKEKQVIPTGGDPSELEDVEVPEDSELQLLEQCAPPLCHLGPKCLAGGVTDGISHPSQYYVPSGNLT